MNDHDKANFDFIMSLSEEAFDRWLDSLSEDDVEYALELIRTNRHHLIEQETELLMELDGMQLVDAKAVLSQFMRK